MCYNPLNGVGQSGNGEKNQKKQVSHQTKEKYFTVFIKGEIRRLPVPLAFLVSAWLVILNLRVVSPCIRLYIMPPSREYRHLFQIMRPAKAAPLLSDGLAAEVFPVVTAWKKIHSLDRLSVPFNHQPLNFEEDKSSSWIH